MYNPRLEYKRMIFHTRIGKYGRAFVSAPTTVCGKIVLYRRGYRPFCASSLWWTKPSKNQEELERRDRLEQLFRTIR